MVPRGLQQAQYVDVTAAMDERPRARSVSLDVVGGAPAPVTAREMAPVDDPFAGVEV